MNNFEIKIINNNEESLEGSYRKEDGYIFNDKHEFNNHIEEIHDRRFLFSILLFIFSMIILIITIVSILLYSIYSNINTKESIQISLFFICLLLVIIMSVLIPAYNYNDKYYYYNYIKNKKNYDIYYKKVEENNNIIQIFNIISYVIFGITLSILLGIIFWKFLSYITE